MKNLKGKVTFITGGSRGIGAGIAKRLAREGADVIITHTGKNPNQANEVIEAVRAEGVQGIALAANNENTQEIITALETAYSKFGSVDILVNNAGIYATGNITETTPEAYDKMMNVNVKAVFVASQNVSGFMKNSGRIITIGSNMADRIAFPGGSLYAMSKSALSGLTKGMARDLGDREITVNLIQPGPVETDMNPSTADHAPILINKMAIKRYGTVDEIAGLVAFLAGDDGKYITGTSITIDGGFNI